MARKSKRAGRIWLPFEEVIRPLPMMNAKVARPSGHQMKKPRIISAIQAGFPNSSSFATIGILASPAPKCAMSSSAPADGFPSG
jgi:hypothetical protein